METSLQRSVLGVQEPRHRCVPANVDADRSRQNLESVEFVADLAGLVLDPWQVIALEHLTYTRADGRWCALESMIEAPRQNGKTAGLEAFLLTGLAVWELPLMLFSAHEFRTASETFVRMLAAIESTPSIDRMVARVRHAKGEEGVEMKSGARLRFVARATHSGRGLSADVVVLDEALRLTPQQMAAVLPTMSARSVTGNPQVVYASSSGDGDSDVLAAIRKRIVAADPGPLSGAIWCARPWDDLPAAERDRYGSRGAYFDDAEVWAQANPALGRRISVEFVRAERSAMTEDAFGRERLGIWDDEPTSTVFRPGQWEACAGELDTSGERVVLAVETTLDRSSSSIVAVSGTGTPGALVVATGAGTAWVAQRLVAVCNDMQVAAVVIDEKGSTAPLIPGIEDAFESADVSVTLVKTTYADMAEACALTYDAIVTGQIRHRNDPELNAAVAGAVKRESEGAFVWSRRKGGPVIAPLVALSLAYWQWRQVDENDYDVYDSFL